MGSKKKPKDHALPAVKHPTHTQTLQNNLKQDFMNIDMRKKYSYSYIIYEKGHLLLLLHLHNYKYLNVDKLNDIITNNLKHANKIKDILLNKLESQNE